MSGASAVPPPDALGADLYWWRASGEQQTLVTIASAHWSEALDCDEIELSLTLFRTDGVFVATWERTVRRDEDIFIDSREIVAAVPAAAGLAEGVLGVFVRAPRARAEQRASYSRLYGTVDWISQRGDVASLHSDQTTVAESRCIELTEIVFDESDAVSTSLVFLNGPEPRPAGSLRLRVVNHAGEERQATDATDVPAFALQRVQLAALFPDLASFCGGRPATLSGELEARRTFTRPYVVTEPVVSDTVVRLSAYHGGDRYASMSALTPAMYKLLGRGESNPGAVWHDDAVTTVVNVLHTHGTLADDYPVDASLYDAEGRLVARRERWLVATRDRLGRGAIRDLLPEPRQPFRGHLALRFSPSGRGLYPGRLQMLMEYRTTCGVARSMLWSDAWNSVPRAMTRRRIYRACYRVFLGDPSLESFLAITNCGVHLDYVERASVRVVLLRGRETLATHEATLPPNGTLFASMEQLFPRLAERGVVLATVESEHDLASMQFTRHRASGAVAAEHLMAMLIREGDRLVMPCGA